jgi:AcrR family transcriptional regulator
MAKTWLDDDPKAALMTRKRAVIVEAARRAFLDTGYGESSVNRIAADAGVSIKTLYRHFENKDDLFTAVMKAACSPAGQEQTDLAVEEPDWFAEPPAFGLPLAGQEYLRHALSEEQLALYRVVTRDALRFPELGARYRDEVLGQQKALFVRYLERWLPTLTWSVDDKDGAAAIFMALLRAGVFDDALHGWRLPDEVEISRRAQEAAARMLILLEAGSF